MLTNLPSDFTDAIESRSRKPIQLLEMRLNTEEVYYLSDLNVGTLEGLDHEYLPWIESWGTMADNTNITNLYDGNSLEIRQGTVNIIVSPETRVFIKRLYDAGVENTTVYLYQYFIGMESDPVLIDIMACQDPIKHTEASMMLSIDLVSVIMRTNPQLWPTTAGLADQPIIVGKATGVVLKDNQTSRSTTTSDDIAYDYLGPLFIENGIGFVQPAEGETEYVYIDSELIGYSDINVSTITISERAATPPLPATQTATLARPHLRGALVVPYGGVYDFNICSGPVESVSNLMADGEEYTNDVTFFTQQHPVIARFNGRPPWLSAIEGAEGPPIEFDPVTKDFSGTDADSSYGGGGSHTLSGIDNINGGSSATMSMSDTVGGGDDSINRNARTVTEDGSSSFDYTKWKADADSVIGIARLYARTLGDAYPADGALTTTEWTFGYDLSSYGELTSVDLSWAFASDDWDIIGSEVMVTLQLVIGSQVTNLASYHAEAYDENWPSNYDAPWKSDSGLQSISGISWSDLKTAKVQLICEIIQCRDADWSSSPYRVEVSTTSLVWKVNYFVPAGTVNVPWQYVYSTFGDDNTGWGAITEAKAHITVSTTVGSNTTVYREWKKDGTTQTSDSISSTSLNTLKTIDLGVPTWAQLASMSVGFKHSITDDDDEGTLRTANTAFTSVIWDITYQPGQIETPDEERVIYAEELTCDVVGHMGENPTPPQVLEHLITVHSDAADYIDTSDFDAAHAEYLAVDYYLNGVLDAGTDLHTALKVALKEGLCRFIFNQGKIKLYTYFEEQSTEVDYVVSEDDRLLKSAVVENQPTSNIRNTIKILYDKNYLDGTYNGEVDVVDATSVTKYLTQSYERSLALVSSETVAAYHANRILQVLGTPASILSFKMFMAGYILEKGDRVRVQSYVDNRFYNIGNVLTVDRTFGKGKVQQINEFEVSFANPTSYAHLELEDVLEANDDTWNALKGVILPTETVVLDDSNVTYSREYVMVDQAKITEELYTDLEAPDGYGASGYGVFGYGK